MLKRQSLEVLIERRTRHAIERRRLIERAEKAERRAASLEAALRDAERKAAATTRFETLGRLVGGVAHDFNNMLTAIVCEAEQLKRSLDRSDPSHSGAQEIIRSSIRAAELTRQLLTFGRQRTFEAQQLELNGVVEGLSRMLQRLLGPGVRLESALCDDATVVEGELCQLERVVVNLVVNARDAMPTGGRVLVGTRVEECFGEGEMPAGEYVVLSVTDEGTGMTDDVRARLFEPFFTTKRPDEGAGLGLSSVRDIVERAGGIIVVHSEQGAGSCFEVFLPRVGSAVPQVSGER